MFKQLVKLEIKKNEKDYALILPESCSLGELLDVIIDMRTIIINSLQEVVSKQKEDETPNPEKKDGDKQ